MEPRNDHDELLRLRERIHKLNSSVAGLRYRLEAVEAFVNRYGPVIDGMAKSDEIAAGIAAELQRRGTAQFTRWQKLAGGLVALAAVAGVVLQVVHL